MQRARKTARKEVAKANKKQRKIERADIKKVKAAVQAKSPQSKATKLKTQENPKQTKEDKKAEAAVNRAFSKMINPTADVEDKKPC